MREIIWDSHTEKQYILKNTIKKNIYDLLLSAENNNVDIIGTITENNIDKKIKESIIAHPDNIYVIPNTKNGVDLTVFETCRQTYFESNDVWVDQPDNLQTILRLIDVTHIYIIGTSCESDILNFLKYKYNVILILDAIESFKYINDECKIITTEMFISEHK